MQIRLHFILANRNKIKKEKFEFFCQIGNGQKKKKSEHAQLDTFWGKEIKVSYSPDKIFVKLLQ